MTVTPRLPTKPPTTATIYQFPVRTRPAYERRRAEIAHARSEFPTGDFGSGWYHDVAIQDSDRSRNH